MGASIQVMSGIIRGGSKHEKLGDPYEWFVTYQGHPYQLDLAVLEAPHPEATKHFKLICHQLASVGFKRVAFMRFNEAGDERYAEKRIS